MANASPSVLLADSLASLSKSALHAFAQVENQARSEVARVVADAQEARNERDKALDAQHKYQLEGQAWKQEVMNYKASLKQAEISIAHQTETIAQLRREAAQWKDQSRNWQEHFLRVEQERCALSSRVDSLVAERLQWSRPLHAPAPLTPEHQFSNPIDSASSSATTKRASTSSFIPLSSKSVHLVSPPQPESPITTISAHKSNRLQTKPLKPSKPKAAPPELSLPQIVSKPVQKSSRSQKVSARTANSTPAEPRQTIVRRVQAVIHVKREEDDDVLNSDQEQEDAQEEEVQSTGQRNIPRKRRKVTPLDDHDYVEDDDEGHHNIVENARDQSDDDDSAEEDVADDHSEDEDDELMLGAEDPHHELYGTQRIMTTANKTFQSSGASRNNRKRRRHKQKK